MSVNRFVKDKLFQLVGRECVVEAIEAVAGENLTLNQMAIRADQIDVLCGSRITSQQIVAMEGRNIPELISRIQAQDQTPAGMSLAKMNIQGRKATSGEIEQILASGAKVVISTESGDPFECSHVAAIQPGQTRGFKSVNSGDQRVGEFNLKDDNKYTIFVFRKR